MNRTKFTDAQIAFILQQAKVARPAKEVRTFGCILTKQHIDHAMDSTKVSTGKYKIDNSSSFQRGNF